MSVEFWERSQPSNHGPLTLFELLDQVKSHPKFYPVFVCSTVEDYAEVRALALVHGVDVGAYCAYSVKDHNSINGEGKTRVWYFPSKKGCDHEHTN